MTRRRAGFTLVEIMIVVAIIGLLAAIAIPAFIKARSSARRNACINNLRQVDAAKDQYALEYGGAEGCTISVANVTLYIKDIGKCYCPSAVTGARAFTNTYIINVLGSNPTCTLDASNHTLMRGAG